MLQTKAGLVLLFLVVFLLAGLSVASAEIVIYSGDDDVPRAGNLPPETAGDIKINSFLIMKLPGGGGGIPLNVRAEIMDTRITEILSAWIVGPIKIGEIRGKPTIWVGEYRLITVYPEDAAATGTTMRGLAETWAKSVEDVLWKCSPAVGPSLEELAAQTPSPAP